MFKGPTKYSEYIQDVPKSIDYILKRVNAVTVADLQAVTNAGATTTLPINTGGITSDYFQLDTAATPTLAPGMFGWDDAYGTADLRLKGNNVTLQLGQELLARVVNKTGADLLESQYKVVRVRIASEGGAQGQRLAVVLAQGDNDPDSATTLGIVTEDIPNNQEGFITIFGNVNNINTTGSLQGETWVDGDVLYLSPTVPGAITKVKPVAPQHTVIIGYVVYAHNNQGKIFVKVDNGYELDELHNVLITSPANNDLLQYDSAQQVWKNVAPSVAVPTPTLAQVTTAGNTTTNAITVGGLTISNGSASITKTTAGATLTLTPNASDNAIVINNNGFIKFTSGADSFIRGNSTVFSILDAGFGSKVQFHWGGSASWINTGGNLLIGTTTDAGYKLDINGTARIQSDTTVSTNLSVGLTNTFGRFNVRGADNSSTSRAITVQNQSQTLIFDIYNDGRTLLNPQGPGNILIGTTTDAGYKLDVNGTARIQGNTEISRTGADTQLTVARGGGASFTIQGKANSTSQSEGVNLYWTNNTWLKFVLGSSVVANFSNVGNLLVGTSTDAGYKLDVNGVTRVSGTGTFNGQDAFVVRSSAHFIFRVNNDENIIIGRGGGQETYISAVNSGRLLIQNGVGASQTLTGGIQIGTLANYTQGTGTQVFTIINPVFNPTGYSDANFSAFVIAPTINQSANPSTVGLSRGLYINPTLVSPKDFRAIEATVGNVLLCTTSGNVGIGTTTPTAKLQIKGTGDSSVWVTTDDFNTGSNTGSVVRIGTRSSTGNTQGWIDVLNSGVSSYGNLILTGFGGNVLIGTTTDAGYKLDVNGSARVGSLGLYGNNGTITAPLIRFNGSNQVNVDPQGYGTVTNHFLATGNYIFSSGGGIRSNDRFGAKAGTSVVSTPFMSYGISRPDNDASINALAGMGGVHDASFWFQGLGLVFYTSNGPDISGGGYLTEKMRLSSVGNLGLGTSSPTDKIHIVDNTNGNKFARISAGSTDASAAWVAQNDQVDNIVYRVFGSAVTGSQMGQALARSASLIANLGGTGKFLIGSFSGTDLIFGTSDQARMRLVDTTGNFLIGTMTDNGNKLTVSGNIDAQGYKVNNVLGYTGILNIPTNPPGQQNIDIQGGIVVNIF